MFPVNGALTKSPFQHQMNIFFVRSLEPAWLDDKIPSSLCDLTGAQQNLRGDAYQMSEWLEILTHLSRRIDFVKPNIEILFFIEMVPCFSWWCLLKWRYCLNSIESYVGFDVWIKLFSLECFQFNPKWHVVRAKYNRGPCFFHLTKASECIDTIG